MIFKGLRSWFVLLPALVLLVLSLPASAQTTPLTLESASWRLSLKENGHIQGLWVRRADRWDPVIFRDDTYAGVSWYGVWGQKNRTVALSRKTGSTFTGKMEGLSFTLTYELVDKNLVIKASVKNERTVIFKPEKLGLMLGISNYMVNYPQWNAVYFPTLLRSEKTHFWGYFMNPDGRLIGLASPDPVASWSLNYNVGYGSKEIFFWGHRVYTTNLDLINSLPLPDRHPQNLGQLHPGEEKKWTLFLTDVEKLDDIQPVLSPLCRAPLFRIPETTIEAGRSANIEIFSIDPVSSLEINGPGGKRKALTVPPPDRGVYRFDVQPKGGDGSFRMVASTASGKRTEAVISVRKPWSWYMKRAREGAHKYTQKASWNCENWYGFYSMFLAQKYFPAKSMNNKANERFSLVYGLMYDDKKREPTRNADRIQNTASIIGILADKYEAQGDVKDLERAADLADWIIRNSQAADGAYRRGKTHYTSVIYPAKSIMELLLVEKKLAKKGNLWEKRYERHLGSVRKAIGQLMNGPGAVDTEGEMTYEDGMISCSALQIAAFGLLQEDDANRKKYISMAREYLRGHRCLTQLVVPDSHQRGGTLRFWEAQYDVLMAHNMITSPHGWSSWRTYATYYLYLLTGEEPWLVETMNALGSAMQMIDHKTGALRWAFVVDPHVRTSQITENFPGTDPDRFNANQFKTEEGKHRPVTVGEQYVPMIADWFYANSSDNDVHEHFKCLEEVALAAAYVVERSDGTLRGYNCTVRRSDDQVIHIKPLEGIVNRIHVNLRQSSDLVVQWKSGKTRYRSVDKMRWLGKDPYRL